MTGVAHNENVGMTVVRHHVAIIEYRAKALANFINRPPGHLSHSQGIRLKDSFGGADELVEADVLAANTLLATRGVRPEPVYTMPPKGLLAGVGR